MVSREKSLSELASGAEHSPSRLAMIIDYALKPFRRGRAPEPQPATGFFTDTSVCIGCKACEVACKQWNQLPADGFHWTGNSHDNTADLSATSWRHVKFIEQLIEPAVDTPARGDSSVNPLDLLSTDQDRPGRWLMMSDVCKHCVTAPCQQACPTGSLIQNEFENIYVQQDICNGCSYCVAACPFGVIGRATFDGHAHKCTLCYDRQRDQLEPACAKACPTESIHFGLIEDLRQRARERVETLHQHGVTAAYLYGDQATEGYSELNSFYLLVDEPAVYGLPDSPVNPWLQMKGDYLRAVFTAVVCVAFLWATLVLGR
ncbi:MAG: 4Fe-4S dicluster domain-containing protein [Pirellulaceae bacterium]|nr:4Fe-4S dicluster domain-containing protein [Pirellulaceae bacterium]